MTEPDIGAARLKSQRLRGTAFTDAADVVAWLGAVQAQDYSGALWSIGLRLPTATEAAVQKAVFSGELVHTWAMRGTLHLLAAQDAAWMLALLRPRLIEANKRRYSELGLSEETLAEATALLAETVAGGGRHSRQEMRDVLQTAGIATEGQRLYYMLQRAGLENQICIAAQIKNQSHYGHPPAAKDVFEERNSALAELARRYFLSHGPATVQDFGWWSGLLVADARAGLEAIEGELASFDAAGKTYWMAPGLLGQVEAEPLAHCVPRFDEYIVAYGDRTPILADEYAAAWSASKGMLVPSILCNGQISGIWKGQRGKNKLEMSLQLFRPLAGAEREGVTESAERYGRFLDSDVMVTWAAE